MRTILCLSLLMLSPSLFAAIPPKVATKTDMNLLAEEVLTMPEKNRYLVAEKKADQLFPVLMDIANSEKKAMPVRWKALTLAAYLKKDKALPELEKTLKSKEWFMRNASLVAIHSFDKKRSQKAALELIKDKALVVRSAAIEVLGDQPELAQETRDLFWEEMSASYNFRQKQGLWVREQLLEKLAVNPDKKEMPLFVKCLKENSKIHSSAVVAMEKLTQKKLGKANASLEQKRQLWIQWAKNWPPSVLTGL